jgi:hypothetical protein
LFDTVVPRKFARLDASIGASEPHDFAVRISIIRPARYCLPDAAASTASRSAFVTCARPSVGRTVMDIEVIWVRWQAKFLNFRNFVTRPSGRLPLRPGREPINSEWSTDVRFGAHNGLKSDIAPCPKSCPLADIGAPVDTPRRGATAVAWQWTLDSS